MHLQQTKRGDSGGPQYYFHDLPEAVTTYLRSKGAIPVALVTPYGATKSHFLAVGKDSKLDARLKPVPGNVGHDRIQQGHAAESIGEAIRKWYRLEDGQFERIDIEIDIRDDAFYLRPTICKYTDKARRIDLKKVENPLTFTREYKSSLWTRQLDTLEPKTLSWSFEEISRIVQDHALDTRVKHIQEVDLLRASGPLRHMGVTLGGYVGSGYDCFWSTFQFLKFPEYRVPIEIKRRSKDFKYQQEKYGKEELSRAVILCANHDHVNLPPNIDVIELQAFVKS